MDRRRGLNPERLRAAAGKYRYVLAVALLGVVLMLLPSGGNRDEALTKESDCRGAVQQEMERLLAAFDGVGALRLMLTTEPGGEDYAGAVVVCEGADSAAVRLELTQAVSALTGLPSDRITIVKGRP